MRGVPAVLFTDEGGKQLSDQFDELTVIEEPFFRSGDKIGAMLSAPFARCVFLDSDTWVVERFDELFSLGPRWDIGCTFAVRRFRRETSDIPLTFPEFSSGVVAFERSDAVEAMLTDWQNWYRQRLAMEKGAKGDQIDFLRALWASQLKVLPLLPEFNYHVRAPGLAGRGMKVRIVHGHRNSIVGFGDLVNKVLSPRLTVKGRVLFSSGKVV